MRFLFTADVHVQANVVQGQNRLPVYVTLLSELLAIASANKCPRIIIGGDLVHQKNAVVRRDREVYVEVYRFLKEAKKRDIVIDYLRGNHESPSRVWDGDDGGRNACDRDCIMEIFSDVCNVRSRPAILPAASTTDRSIALVPWYPAAKYKEIIRGYIDSELMTAPKKPILITHVGLAEGSVGASNYYPPQAVSQKDLNPESWGLILCGDYHKHQKIGNNIFYVGAPIPHCYGDVGNVGVFIVDTDEGGKISMKIHRLSPSYPKFVEFTVTTTENIKDLVSEIKSDSKPYWNHYRVHATPELMDIVQAQLYEVADRAQVLSIKGTAHVRPPEGSRMALDDASCPERLLARWLDYRGITDDSKRGELLELGRTFF